MAVASDFTITPTFDTAFRWATQIGANPEQNNAALDLRRGVSYTFDVNTSALHPFRINDVSGNPYGGTGLSANGVTSATTITFAVPDDAPDQLFYNCEVHSTMSGIINIHVFKDGFDTP